LTATTNKVILCSPIVAFPTQWTGWQKYIFERELVFRSLSVEVFGRGENSIKRFCNYFTFAPVFPGAHSEETTKMRLATKKVP
jgi:hypothetical protein